MGHDDNVKVTVLSEEKGTLVVETPEGKQKTYYLNPIRTMRLLVTDLQVNCGANALAFGMPGRLPPPEFTLGGQAWLERGEISVIGEPSNTSRCFKIAFKAYNEVMNVGPATGEENVERRCDLVTLGFSRHDWEIGNDDEWFIECYVSPQMMEAIVSGVSSGNLQHMNLNLHMERIYTDDNWAPPSMSADWFLRPSRPDNCLKMPELAHGAITGLNFGLGKVNMRPKDEPEPQPGNEVENEVEAPEPEPDQRVLAIGALSRKVEELQATIKTVGWAIAGAIIVLVFKLH